MEQEHLKFFFENPGKCGMYGYHMASSTRNNIFSRLTSDPLWYELEREFVRAWELA
jgi:hypothetical protein